MSSTAPPDEQPPVAADATEAYYDEFARRYDEQRGGQVPRGYHDLIDDLEIDFLARHAGGKSVLEVGCGTGLLLSRVEQFALEAQGVDISEGMLERARQRGLQVQRGSATDLPFADDSFDVSCSFKVLAHVPEIQRALAEMVRVVRPGGLAVAEFYNPWSLRGLVKRLGPARAISAATTEAAVYTRFDSPAAVRRYLPAGARIVDSRGVRVVTPAAMALRAPVLGAVLRSAEWALCDSPLGLLGGFWIAAIRKGPHDEASG